MKYTLLSLLLIHQLSHASTLNCHIKLVGELPADSILTDSDLTAAAQLKYSLNSNNDIQGSLKIELGDHRIKYKCTGLSNASILSLLCKPNTKTDEENYLLINLVPARNSEYQGTIYVNDGDNETDTNTFCRKK